jgi:hypothetical protein
MGTYVYYSLGRKDGIREAVMERMPSFSEWLHESHERYPGDYDASLIAMVDRLAKEGDAALSASSLAEARLVDLAIEVLVDYCQIEGIELFEGITPSAHKWCRYAGRLEEVVPSCTSLGASYYQRMFSGRSLVELPNHQYVSGDGVFHISWLLPREVSEFRSDIESYGLDFRAKGDWVHGVYCIYESLKRAEKENVALVVVIA